MKMLSRRTQYVNSTIIAHLLPQYTVFTTHIYTQNKYDVRMDKEFASGKVLS